MEPSSSSASAAEGREGLRRSLAVRSFSLQLADALDGKGLLAGALLDLPLQDVVDTLHRLADAQPRHPAAHQTPPHNLGHTRTPLQHYGPQQPPFWAHEAPPIQHQLPAPPPVEYRVLVRAERRHYAPGQPPSQPLAQPVPPPSAPHPSPPVDHSTAPGQSSGASGSASGQLRPPPLMTLRLDRTWGTESSASLCQPTYASITAGYQPTFASQPSVLVVAGGSRGEQGLEYLIAQGSQPLTTHHLGLPKTKALKLPNDKRITKESFGVGMSDGVGGQGMYGPSLVIVTPGAPGFFRLSVTGSGPQPCFSLEHCGLISCVCKMGAPKMAKKLVSRRGQAVEAKDGLVLLTEAKDSVHLFHVPFSGKGFSKTELQPLRPPRRGSASVFLGESLFVCGGDAAGSVSRLRGPSLGWETLPALPEALRDHSAVAFKGRVVVGGGRGPFGEPRRGVWSLAPGGWEAMGSLVRGRWGLSLVELGGRLVAVGGEGEAEETAHSAELWEEAEGRWRLLPVRFRHPVHRASVAAIPLDNTPNNGKKKKKRL